MNEFLNREIIRMGSFILTPEKLLAVVVIICFTAFLLFLIRKFILRDPHLTVSETGRRTSFFLLIKYLLWVMAISTCIEALGFSVSLLLAGSAALLVGLGFGLQNIFSDFISGIFLLFEQTIKVGDIMEVDKVVGRVQHISMRTSILQTRNGLDIIIPNHKFIADNVINWSRQTFDCRFYIEIGVAYDSDVNRVTEVLLACAKAQPEILHGEQMIPSVRLTNFGDSALEFQLLFWTEEIFGVESIKSQMRYKIVEAFRKEGIVIPFPQRDLHVYKDLAATV